MVKLATARGDEVHPCRKDRFCIASTHELKFLDARDEAVVLLDAF